MKKIILVLLILQCTILQAQVYQTSDYDVTVTDLYGNYNKFKVQIENNTLQQPDYSPQQPDYSMANAVMDWAESLTETNNYNSNNESATRIKYLEFELRKALNTINNQASLLNIEKTNCELIETLAEKEIDILKMQINEYRKKLGLPPIIEESKPPKDNDKDCNGDGVVSMDEMIYGKGCDCNGDGIVSYKEATSGCK